MLLDGAFTRTRIDDQLIPRADLDIAVKRRSNPLPWNGQFSPQLVEVLIDRLVSPDAVLMDPFVGSGTTLHEAALSGRSAYGVELNPAAYCLAKVYELVTYTARDALLVELDNLLSDLAGPELLVPPNCDGLEIASNLIDMTSTLSGAEKILAEALVVLTDFGRSGDPLLRLQAAWIRIRNLVLRLPCDHGHHIEAILSDARILPLPACQVDFVITSPPYINVFNYHQNYRRSVEMLGWNVLDVARSEIGSNRKHRGNRFLTVIQYCLDMAMVLCELTRVLRPGGQMVFVVGRESNVRGTAFYNGELLAEIGHCLETCSLETRQERVFRNRFGQNIVEDLLHFQTSGRVLVSDDVMQMAREVARRALHAAKRHAPRNSMADLEEAIERSEEIEPSRSFVNDRG